MLRQDGDFTVYVLEAKGKKGKWFSPSYDHFGTPDGFDASADCWQKLGLHATFIRRQGLDALSAFSEKYPEHKWRLAEVKLSQHHKVIAQLF